MNCKFSFKNIEGLVKKIFFLLALNIFLSSCQYPYDDFNCRKYDCNYDWYNGYHDDGFLHESVLLGTWECYYPMIITGLGEIIGTQPNIRYEMKQMKFGVNYCDILISEIGSVERKMYTFNYLYDGSTLRFSRNNRTIIFKIDGYIYPELFISDSFGKYTIKKNKAAEC